MDTEDPFYNSQTVVDEVMLLALELTADGITNEEVAYGLMCDVSVFAKLITDTGVRNGLAEWMEMMAAELRTEPPIDPTEKPWFMPEELRNQALVRLEDQARQEGRDPEPVTEADARGSPASDLPGGMG